MYLAKLVVVLMVGLTSIYRREGGQAFVKVSKLQREVNFSFSFSFSNLLYAAVVRESLCFNCKFHSAGRGATYRNDRGGASKHDSDVKLVGKNTFAAPRAVRPLVWTNKDAKPADSVEKPKSNDEFRSMLLKK